MLVGNEDERNVLTKASKYDYIFFKKKSVTEIYRCKYLKAIQVFYLLRAELWYHLDLPFKIFATVLTYQNI